MTPRRRAPGSMPEAIVIALVIATSSCGDTSTQAGGSGAGASGQGGAGAGPDVPEGGAKAITCADFDNWGCHIVAAGCFVNCYSTQIACDSQKCVYSTSQSSSALCEEYQPQNLDGCDDCVEAYNAGCFDH